VHLAVVPLVHRPLANGVVPLRLAAHPVVRVRVKVRVRVGVRVRVRVRVRVGLGLG